MPQTTGKFLLKAIAAETSEQSGGPTVSRRQISIVAEK
jgi:hypothetical protein